MRHRLYNIKPSLSPTIIIVIALVLVGTPALLWADDDVRNYGIGEGYDPENPPSPSLVYNLQLESNPPVAANFSLPAKSQIEPDIQISVSTNAAIDGFEFVNWTCNGIELSNKPYLTMKMPYADTKLTANYQWTPSLPPSPATNFWDPETGTMVIDDFQSGKLSQTISNLLGDRINFEKLDSLIVKGVISGNLHINWSDYPNLHCIDLSRSTVDGNFTLNFASSCATKICLPKGITSLNYSAIFPSTLQQLWVYDIIPPKAFEDVFKLSDGSLLYDKGCQLYVPNTLLYSNAEVWKNFNINQIDGDLYALEVLLPQNADSKYRNCFIELQNVKTLSAQKYLVTDRISYKYINLQTGDEYIARLLLNDGEIIGQTDIITMGDSDTSVQFDQVKTLNNVSAMILTPDGEDITDISSIDWFITDGYKDTHIGHGRILNQILEGKMLKASIKIPDTHAIKYIAPSDTNFIVNDGNNLLTINLKAFDKIDLSGIVSNTDGTPIFGALVSSIQTFNGKYTNVTSTSTGQDGRWKLSVLSTDTQIECSANGYQSTRYSSDVSAASDISFTLKPLSKSVINFSLTYTEAGKTTSSRYLDYRDVSLSVYNSTLGRDISDMTQLYPQLVISDVETLPEHTLIIKAHSLSGKFADVSVSTQLSSPNISIPIIGKGAVHAEHKSSDCQKTMALLYDDKGQLVRNVSYDDSAVSISEIDAGEYTLITISDHPFLEDIRQMDYLTELGFKSGVDYVISQIVVSDGEITTVEIDHIPSTNLNIGGYVSTSSGLSVNKLSAAPGSYITLTSTIDFEHQYKNDISDIEMIFELPTSCKFVDKSLMRGAVMYPYNLDGNRITVNLGKNSDKPIKLVVIPTSSGEECFSAYVRYKYGNKTILQPIGQASCYVEDHNLSVPTVVSEPTLNVRGCTVPYAAIQVYDGNHLIAETMADATGAWMTTSQLHNPLPLSVHDIRAKITTLEGTVMYTRAMGCSYEPGAPLLSKITMIYNDLDYIFDFINPSKSMPTYSYSTSTFTFTVDFSVNDPDIINDVVLYVYTSDNGVRRLHPKYDVRQGKWVVAADFDSNRLPINVDATFQSLSLIESVDQYADLLQEQAEKLYFETDAQIHSADSVYCELKDLILQDNASSEQIDDAFDRYFSIIITGSVNHKIAEVDEEGLLSRLKAASTDAEKLKIIDDERDIYYSKTDNQLSKEFIELENALNQGGDQVIPPRENPHVKYPPFAVHADSPLAICGGALPNLPDRKWTIDSVSLHKDKPDIKIKNDSIIVIEIDPDDILPEYDEEGEFDIWAMEAERVATEYETDERNIQLMTNVGGSVIDVCNGIANKAYDTALRNLKFEKMLHNMLITHCDEINYNASLELVNKRWDDLQRASRVRNITNPASNILTLTTGAIGIIDDVTMAVLTHQKWNKLEGLITTSCDSILSDSLMPLAKLYHKEIIRNYVVKSVYDVGMYGARIVSSATPTMGVAPILLNLAGGVLDWKMTQWQTNFERIDMANYSSIESTLLKHCKLPANTDSCTCAKDGKCTCPKPCKCTKNTPNGDLKVVIDPSGYVYEAVPDNRVEGVKATIYYQDNSENAIVWDATEYQQQNPLYTNTDGMYQWDVPQGLWQVKFEKDGYLTTYTDWLPVPPPQLDINIGITQVAQPLIKYVKAYGDGVIVCFDKYMDISTLNMKNIYAIADDNILYGDIVMLDEQRVLLPDGRENSLASVCMFKLNEPLAKNITSLCLYINRDVKSYAGIPMAENYIQPLDIEEMITDIIIDDDNVFLTVGSSIDLNVRATPAEAAFGSGLYISNNSELIAKIEPTNDTFDTDGYMTLHIDALLPGTTVVTLSLPDGIVTQKFTVTIVADGVAAPVASIPSGSTVQCGTELSLSCSTPDAVIYYTLDGSCPCMDTSARLIYDDDPIVINQTMLLRAMAMVDGMDESATVDFYYIVEADDGIEDIFYNYNDAFTPVLVQNTLRIHGDEPISSVVITDIKGNIVISTSDIDDEVILDLSHVASGVYVLSVANASNSHSQKIIKR